MDELAETVDGVSGTVTKLEAEDSARKTQPVDSRTLFGEAKWKTIRVSTVRRCW
jgi:hypothetical protein